MTCEPADRQAAGRGRSGARGSAQHPRGRAGLRGEAEARPAGVPGVPETLPGAPPAPSPSSGLAVVASKVELKT